LQIELVISFADLLTRTRVTAFPEIVSMNFGFAAFCGTSEIRLVIPTPSSQLITPGSPIDL
jgi:hypothetical protein